MISGHDQSVIQADKMHRLPKTDRDLESLCQHLHRDIHWIFLTAISTLARVTTRSWIRCTSHSAAMRHRDIPRSHINR